MGTLGEVQSRTDPVVGKGEKSTEHTIFQLGKSQNQRVLELKPQRTCGPTVEEMQAHGGVRCARGLTVAEILGLGWTPPAHYHGVYL